MIFSVRARNCVVLTCWIQCVNVQGQVHRVLGANPINSLLNDAIGTNLVNLPRLDNLEATVAIIIIVAWTGQCGANSSMDVCVVGEKAFLGCMVKVRAVVNAGYFAGRATKNLWFPC